MRPLLPSRLPTSLLFFVLGLALCALQVRAAQTNSVSIADGPPFSIIRGDKVFEAAKGAKLLAGDFIETQAGNFVVVELPGAAVAALGPSTRLYFLEHSDVPTFVVMRGWLKLDAKGSGEGGPHRAVGLQLGAAAREGVFVMHVADHRDELFHEAGVMTLLLRDDAATRSERESKVTQFFVREDRNPVAAAPRPAAPFIAAMPVPFRDPLPFGLANDAKAKITEPKFIRDVADLGAGAPRRYVKSIAKRASNFKRCMMRYPSNRIRLSADSPTPKRTVRALNRGKMQRVTRPAGQSSAMRHAGCQTA